MSSLLVAVESCSIESIIEPLLVIGKDAVILALLRASCLTSALRNLHLGLGIFVWTPEMDSLMNLLSWGVID